ncbi:redox-sensitive transcriptional activator SoxR [Glutamicibacter sp.]|uniref:redox-sensitive transcriptional activator SoxR n=1 Tax=Glutamicibacter sp. TaxID=1931995 RepID=UPI0028BEB3BA|nr:redox-sensitive transcriptional activator SoxR [Glutamicibacter sp.]
MSSSHRIAKSQLGIGDLARRAGVTVATLRFYESRELIFSTRTSGNMRIYPKHTLRRVAIIAAGQRVGLTLTQISEALSELPVDRAPSQKQWEELSGRWKILVDRRIEQLNSLRDSLDGCIGCGCLSTTKCSLFNPQDEAAAEGPGSRWIRNFDADFGPHES